MAFQSCTKLRQGGQVTDKSLEVGCTLRGDVTLSKAVFFLHQGRLTLRVVFSSTPCSNECISEGGRRSVWRIVPSFKCLPSYYPKHCSFIFLIRQSKFSKVKSISRGHIDSSNRAGFGIQAWLSAKTCSFSTLSYLPQAHYKLYDSMYVVIF